MPLRAGEAQWKLTRASRDVRGTSNTPREKSHITLGAIHSPGVFPARSILLNITAFRKVSVTTLYGSREDNIGIPALRKFLGITFLFSLLLHR